MAGGGDMVGMWINKRSKKKQEYLKETNYNENN